MDNSDLAQIPVDLCRDLIVSSAQGSGLGSTLTHVSKICELMSLGCLTVIKKKENPTYPAALYSGSL